MKPQKPIKKIPEPPKEPIKPSNAFDAIIILIVLLVAGIIIGIVAPLIGLLLIGAGIYFPIKLLSTLSESKKLYKEKYEAYLRDQNDFNNLIRNYDEKHIEAVQFFQNISLPRYKVEHEKYLLTVKQLKTHSEIHQYQQNELMEYLSDATKALRVNHAAGYNTGITELFFMNYLEDKFGSSVQVGRSIVNQKLKGMPYLPDFIIFVSELNLYIDVEIDEPYIGSDGTQIHCINGIDKNRNDFFLSNKWIVVRFAEIQIVKYPNECCKVIKLVIEWVKGSDKHNVQAIKNSMPNHQGWTEEDAHRLAFIRFRNKYLPKNLVEDLTQETMELERKFLQFYHNDDDSDLPF